MCHSHERLIRGLLTLGFQTADYVRGLQGVENYNLSEALGVLYRQCPRVADLHSAAGIDDKRHTVVGSLSEWATFFLVRRVLCQTLLEGQ